jgi:hypothetical protein
LAAAAVEARAKSKGKISILDSSQHEMYFNENGIDPTDEYGTFLSTMVRPKYGGREVPTKR